MHSETWAMVLRDDGTLDTLIVCDACHAEYRYSFDGEGDREYENFIDWACNDASDQHSEDIA